MNVLTGGRREVYSAFCGPTVNAICPNILILQGSPAPRDLYASPADGQDNRGMGRRVDDGQVVRQF